MSDLTKRTMPINGDPEAKAGNAACASVVRTERDGVERVYPFAFEAMKMPRPPMWSALQIQRMR